MTKHLPIQQNNPRPEVLGFLRTIKEEPECDVHRLILADWLEEQGDPRAEFIRCQLEKYPLRETDPLHKSLEKAEKQLLRKHGKVWRGPIDDLKAHWSWDRGLAQISLDGKKAVSAPWAAWASSEAFAWISSLSLSIEKKDTLLDHRLTPLMREVNRLSLSGEINDHIDTLTQLDELPYFCSLDLSCCDVNLADVRPLLSWSLLPQIRELDFGSNNRFGNEGVKALVKSPLLGQLRSLNVWSNSLTASGIEWLANAEALQSITWIDLSFNDFDKKAAAFLAKADWQDLQVLDLCWNDLGSAGAKAMVNTDSKPNLREINLRGNGIGTRGIQALIKSPWFEHVQILDLSHNKGGDAAVNSLVNSTHAQNVRWLNFDFFEMTDKGAKALAESPYLDNLAYLDVGWNSIRGAGKEALKDRFGSVVVGLDTQYG